MPSRDLTADPPTARIRLLVADDDDSVQSLFAALLRDAAGVASVMEAKDGMEAVELGRTHRPEVAVLDLKMPRLDGIAAALALQALEPAMQIALHSSDPDVLCGRASELGLPLFDKVDFDRLLAWVERQAADNALDTRVTPQLRRSPQGQQESPTRRNRSVRVPHGAPAAQPGPP